MKSLFGIIMLTTSLAASAKLVVYPAGRGVETLGDFTVEVCQAQGPWQNVDVYPVKVDRVGNGRHNVEVASMAYFDFDGSVDVRVISHRQKPDTARIRPLSYGVDCHIAGDTVSFSLARPSNISVEINGDIFHNLHLFANPLDTERPTESQIKKDDKLLYYGPGLHQLPGDTLRVASGTKVYVDGGARVLGTFIAEGVHDVSFCGRGEIHPRGRGAGIEIRRSHDISAEGVIVTQLPTGQSHNVNIDNVKSISSYGWGDGMNVFAGHDIHYNNVFCRNSDDCSTVYATRKGFVGGCHDIVMENSTLWADVAHPIMIGLHGAATEIGVDAPADTISGILYRNIDILDHAEEQIDYQGCLAINCGDNNVVRDVTFDDIRVEDFRRGQLFNIRIFFNHKYCAAPGRSVENVTLRNISYNGTGDELSIIAGYDADHRVGGITFDNLTINGRHIHDDMPGKPKWYKTSDFARIFIGEHVDNVVFK